MKKTQRRWFALLIILGCSVAFVSAAVVVGLDAPADFPVDI